MELRVRVVSVTLAKPNKLTVTGRLKQNNPHQLNETLNTKTQD